MELPFSIERMGIYGAGLLGGSIGLAVKKQCPSVHITGIGRTQSHLRSALERNAIDDYCCTPSELNPDGFDLLILCTPVRMIPLNLKETVHAVKPGGLITDVGSTKLKIVSSCEEITGSKRRFIGSHPMAGSHQSGIEAASADLFAGKVCILTPTENTNDDALQNITAFWQWLGMDTIFMPPQQHDKLTARASHLPHLIASALCKIAETQGDDLIHILGDGFKDTTRIAGGDPNMWLHICLENPSELVQSLKEMQQVTADLLTWIETQDQDKLFMFLQQTQKWKRNSESKV